MNSVELLVDRVRPLVSAKSWDYGVVWKLDGDQKCIELAGCCCDGADSFGVDDLAPLLLPPCRDTFSPHPTKPHCHLLSQLPSSMSLEDSANRDHAEAFMSSQPTWISLSDYQHNSNGKGGTRVLIPIPPGALMIELFSAKPVSEDPSIMEFITSEINSASWGQEAMSILGQELESPVPIIDEDEFHMNHQTSFDSQNNPVWMSQAALAIPDTINNLPWDLSSLDQIRLCGASPTHTIHGSTGELIPPRDDIVGFDGSSTESILSDRHMIMPGMSSSKDDPQAYADQDLPNLVASSTALATNKMSCVITKDQGQDQKDSVKQEMMGNIADSISDCSDQIEDDEDQKLVGRSGRRHQSKNLVAERKRRKKLNDRLYALRALVPKITKMDRASILGDAIEFVKELQKQVKELQDELEEPSNGGDNQISKIDNPNSTQSEIPNENGICVGNKLGAQNDSLDLLKMESRNSSRLKQSQDYAATEDKTQQMEVQVDVTQINGNEFFLKVFCEYKPSGFARLMEAMNSLGLEVTNANVTTFRGLVLNVFKVEKRDNELVQADHVRESLLELTRNPLAGWTAQRSSLDYHHQHHNHYINSHHHHLHSLQIQT